jgi:hypothetical protein
MKRLFEKIDLIDISVAQYGKLAEALGYLPRWLLRAVNRLFRFEFRKTLKGIKCKFRRESRQLRREARKTRHKRKASGEDVLIPAPASVLVSPPASSPPAMPETESQCGVVIISDAPAGVSSVAAPVESPDKSPTE